MLLVTFQVMTCGVSAARPESVPIADYDDVGAPSPSGDVFTANNTTQTNSPSSSAFVPAPFIPPSSEGSVESFYDGDPIIVSDAPPSYLDNYMTREPAGICYWTANGTYIFNESRPWSVSLISLEGRRMVRESYFTLILDGLKLEPSASHTMEVGEHSYVVSYYLSGQEGKFCSEMLINFDFTDGKNPKATVQVTDVLEDIGTWSVVWTVVPHPNLMVNDPSLAGESALLRGLPGTDYIPTDLKLRTSVEGDDLLIDWSDAKSGTPDIQLLDDKDPFAGAVLNVIFPVGERLIDPSLVCTSSNTDPLDVSCQRKVFWYDGYYWLFYNSGTAICYRNSADGATWSSETAMPEGTTPYSGIGFDVASRNGYVVVGWEDTSQNVYVKKGVLFGNKILWSGRDLRNYPDSEVDPFEWPIAVAIGSDNSFYITHGFYYDDGYEIVCTNQFVDRSQTGEPGTWFTDAYWIDNVTRTWKYWNVLLPITNGYIALLQTSYYSISSDNEKVSVRYNTVQWWTTPIVKDIDLASGSSPGYKNQNISAVASPNGTVHITYKGTDGNIRYACIYPNGASFTSVIGSGLYYPTISLDANGVLHVYYVVTGNPQTIYQQQKPEFGGAWSSATLIYTGPSGQRIRGLTCAMNPVGVDSLTWSEDTGTTRNIKYASIPLPFGTPGSPSDPWNRDGLSPYGTYFSMNSDYISPGNGLMTMTQTLVSIPGRGGNELGVSLIYQQPKYFWSNGTAYGNKPYPFCNVGSYWSLDLPWMDSYYVYLANGQRFVISWGNYGNTKEFVCHDSVHFVLRKCTKDGGYYELITSQGIRYKFENTSSFKLTQISDLDNYNPASSTYTVPYNCLNFTYSSNMLQYITESGLGRRITFSLNSPMTTITRPDGKTFTLAYSSGRLSSITDPLNRVTSFVYNSTANYCLGETAFPTGGKSILTFVSDTTPSTEMKTWLVTSESIKNGSAYIRKTAFDYKIVNGRVTFCKVSNFDESLAFKGSNEYVFQSAMKCSAEIVRDSSGAQMSKKVTWYDAFGQPARFDTYMGDPSAANGLFSSGWSWRKAHTIAGTADGAQTNYQLKLTVNYGAGSDSGSSVYCDSNCKADFSDLRFTSSDGVTLLDHWIESYTASTSAVVWVEIPSIPASPGSVSIYMYYGNSAASSASNGDSTFLFFDDFPGTSLDANKWEVVGQTITYTVANSKLSVTDKGGADWGQSCVGFRAKQGGGTYNPPDDSFAMEAIGLSWSSSGTSPMTHWGPALSDATTDKCYVEFLDAWAYQYGAKSSLIDATSYSSGYGTLAASGIVRTLTTKDSSNNVRHYWDGSLIQGPLADATDYSQLFINVEKYSTYPLGTLTLDSVFLRKFTATAPTSSSWGDAEGAYTGTTEYASYDDWGNRIFTRDALGHESYSTFTNTSTSNSFQGGEVLSRTSTGKILYDSFDDWEYSDWSMYADSPNTVQLDATADPPRSPSVKLTRAGTAGYDYAYHGFTMQTSNFYLQTSFMTSSTNPSYYIASAQGGGRTYFRSYNGNFQYCDPSGTWYNVATCTSNRWYDLGFYIKYGTGYFDGTYDIYIDGSLVKSSAPFYNIWSGTYIDNVMLMAGNPGDAATTLWFDNLRVYRSLTVTINGLDSSYITELYDSHGTLLDRSEGSTLSVVALPLFAPPAYIKVIKIGNGTYCSPMSDVWGGDVYSLSKGLHKSSLPKLTRGFGSYNDRTNDDAKPAGSTEVTSMNGNGQYDLIWVDDAVTGKDFSVSGSKHHVSAYVGSGWYNPVHWHGFTGATTTMSLSSSDILTQYIWLEDGKIPMEIAIQVYANGAWRRAYWGGSGSTDIIDITGTTYDPTVKVSCGSLPTATGQWVQLTVKASDLGFTSSWAVTGVIYALFGGTAKWDLTSKYTEGIVINGLTSGYKVKMTLDNKTVIQGTATSSSLTLTPMSSPSVVRAYPVAATFEVQDSNSKTLYLSPRIPEVYNRDQFTYSSKGFYVNTVKDGIHSRLVGSLTYQDYALSVAQENYLKYDWEGNAVETKSKLSSGWVYTRSGYDMYGNQLWGADQTGRKSVSEFSASNKNTFPLSTVAGDRVDFFDFDTTWSYSETPSDRTWLGTGYSSVMSYSADKSLRFAFSGAPSTNDNGMAQERKEFKTNLVQKITTKFYLDWYNHNEASGEYMDSGIRMRLYNSGGSNYATYTYWLACWYGTSENRTAPDVFTKVVYGLPAMGVWKEVSLFPNTDFSIDWSICDKVAFELYTNVYMAYGDLCCIYFDDLTFNDLTKEKTSFAYDNNNGRVIASTDPCDHTTSKQYDAVGRVVRENNSDATYRTVTYDDTNNKATSYDELSRKTISYFDKIGRGTRVERYGTWSTSPTVTKQTFNWQDKVATSTDALNRVTTYTYDYLGRVTSVKNPDNSQATTTYDDKNKLITSLNELSHKTVSVLDDIGRLNQTREYITSTSYYTTKMAYNAVGQLITVRQDNGEVTRMYYDSLGRQISIAYPDSKSESYTYDEAGRILTTTSRSGQVTTSAYDTAGNNIRVIGTSDTIRTKYNADGLVSEKINSLGNISYHYNNRDLLYRLVQKVSPNSYSFTYTYNAAGDVIYVDYPDARRITYLYDRFGRAVDVKIGNTLLLNITYNADDSAYVKKYCNSNSSLTYMYNTRGFVSKIRGVNVTSGAVFLNLNYNYTLDGDVANIKDTSGTAGNEYYWYDNLGRITKAMANSTFGTIMYGYSSVGNRIWKNEAGVNRTYWYNLTYNKMNAGGGYSYVYDADGNVIWKNQTSPSVQLRYIYNSFGQMTQVDRYVSGAYSATLAKYYYDANGARAKTDESGTISRYVYSGHDPMYYNSTDGKGHKDIYLGGRQELRIVSPSEKWAYMADALGSTRKVLQNGRPGSATFSAVTYKPFGPVVTTTGSDKFTYAGEMQDSPTGLVYLFARYYDPELGRFYALDAELGRVSNPVTLNRYVYCGNSPLKFTDPTGKWWFLAAIGICAAAGAVLGVLDAYTHNDMANAWKYAAAGAITWAEFPLILRYAPSSFKKPEYVLGGLSFEYNALKTYFITGDVPESLKEGAKGGIQGYLVGKFFGYFGFEPFAAQGGVTIAQYVTSNAIKNGIIKGFSNSLIGKEIMWKYDTFKKITGFDPFGFNPPELWKQQTDHGTYYGLGSGRVYYAPSRG